MIAPRMNVDDALMTALDPILPGCVFPNVYVGRESEYLVTSFTALPDVHTENGPAAARYLVIVRYYLPTGKNPNPTKLRIQQALYDQGFTWPSITPASDNEGQGWVFECEYVNAGGVYGFT